MRSSAFDPELLATYQAARHFRYFIEVPIFHVDTDHKPLIFAFSSSADISLRQAVTSRLSQC